jgi:hypothetical protein
MGPEASGFAEAAEPRLMLFDDVERAVLSALRSYEIWPGEAFSEAPVREAAAAQGFEPQELDRAFAQLREKACLRDLGDGRITFTKQGFLAALQAA